MSVTIYKVTESYPKTSRIAVIKKSAIMTCETYQEALQEIENLKNKNTKDNVSFLTSDINK